MDEQEVLNQIKELQKQRTSLKKQDAALVYKINELRDKLEFKNIKKSYYTNNHGLFCRVCSIENDSVLVYELDTIEPLYLTKKFIIVEFLKRHIVENALKKNMTIL